MMLQQACSSYEFRVYGWALGAAQRFFFKFPAWLSRIEIPRKPLSKGPYALNPHILNP